MRQINPAILYSNASASTKNEKVIGINQIKLRVAQENKKKDLELENTILAAYTPPLKKKVTFAESNVSISANCYKPSKSSDSESESS